MKMLSIFITAVVVIVVLIGGLIFFRSANETEAPVAEEETNDEATPSEVPINQFVQQAPSSEPTTSSSPAVSSSEASGDVVEVLMDETGFTPSTLTIASGTTVRFINNGQAAHWPASDVHPTHQILPEFDAKHGLATGETYEFTFTKPGTWTMHDHLFAQNTGSITVQ